MTAKPDRPADLVRRAEAAMQDTLTALAALRDAGVDSDGYVATGWVMSKLYGHPVYARWIPQGRSMAKPMLGRTLVSLLHLSKPEPSRMTAPTDDAAA